MLFLNPELSGEKTCEESLTHPSAHLAGKQDHQGHGKYSIPQPAN